MQKKFTLILLFVLLACVPTTLMAGVKLNDTNFPDEIFRNWVNEHVDVITNDNYISDNEIKNVTTINVENLGISNLKGIEYFIYLTDLNARDNSIESVDLSSNTKLETLVIGNNQLTSLNVANLKALKVLKCYQNNISELDLSNNGNLEYLWAYRNPINALDLSNNPNLIYLSIHHCPNLESIDLTHNTKLKEFYCWYDNFTSLDFSKNLNLHNVQFNGCHLTSIDLSKNTNLKQDYTPEYNGDGSSSIYDELWFQGQTIEKEMAYVDGKVGFQVVPGLKSENILNVKVNGTSESGATSMTNNDNTYFVLYPTPTKRKQLYVLNDDKTAGTCSITYDYKTGYTGKQTQTMDVTVQTLSYVLPFSEKAGCATLCLPYNAKVPDGVKVYTVYAIIGNRAKLKPFTESVLPANTGVLVYGTGASVWNKTDEAATTVTGNLLVGVIEDKTVAAESVMTLGFSAYYPNKPVGFYKYLKTNIAANTCYLNMDSKTPAKGYLLEFDDATGIDEAPTVAESADDAWYSIEGVKMSGKPAKGGLYIHNGKKVIVNE